MAGVLAFPVQFELASRRPHQRWKVSARMAPSSGQSSVRPALDVEAFSFYDRDKQDWTALLGALPILVASLSADFKLQGNCLLNPGLETC